MRKIEEAMTAAIRTRESWQQDNTQVRVYSDPRGNNPHEIDVLLHGNRIANFRMSSMGDVSKLRVSLAGWNTRTTRSRLDAVMRAVFVGNGGKGVGVSSRKGVNRIHDARGETVIDADGWHEVTM